MLSTSDFRKGRKLALDGELYEIVDFQHARTAQRRANVWTRMKNLKTGSILERSFAAGEMFDEPNFEQKKMQYMYTTGSEYHFMDQKSYEQVELSTEQVGDYKWYLVENEEYKILFFEANPISLDLPAAAVLKVVECEPGVKGDSVSNLTKGAKLQTGLQVKVPLFVKEGDMVKVDTRSGEYLERM